MATTKKRASPKLSVDEKSSFAKTMEMLNMDESTKHLLDITSVFTAVGSLLSWLPHLASLFTIVWLGLRIWETENRRVAKTKKAINDARRK
jgi:hypothetical protein